MEKENNKSMSKAVLLGFAIVAMIPVASNLQSISGSINEQAQNKIAMQSANAEKDRLEGEMAELKGQLEKLSEIIEKFSSNQ